MNIVRVFKNDKAFMGTLLIQCFDGDVIDVQTKGDITALYNKEKQLLGYNIANATYKSEHDGYQPMNEDLLDWINQALSKEGFGSLTHDFTARIVVGLVERCDEHPDSDHLHVCQVNVGEQTLQIVCGAQNVSKDAYVVVALEGAVMPDGKLIQNGKLRGVKSYGMLCSEWELGLVKEKQKGLLLLDDTYILGASIFAERKRHHV